MKIRDSNGFTLIELLIVVAIIGIIAAIAVPGLLRARQAGNEASAIGSMSAINKAQASFAATCGNNYYSPSLENLGTGPIANSPGYISPDIGKAGTVVKSGYTIAMGSSTGVVPNAPASCNGLGVGAVVGGYFATALADASGGSRDFGTNTTGTIFSQPRATALTMTDTSSAGTPIQ